MNDCTASYRTRPQARLLARLLARPVASTVTSARRWRRTLGAAALALGLSLPGYPGFAQTIVNPELFGKSLSAAHKALEHYGRYDDEEAMRRVADIGYLLAAHSGFTKYPFTFFLVEMREPNAFALPGGQIFITRGMLDLGLSDDELAGLLGHEIAHVTLEHGTKLQRRATLLNVLSQALLVGVILGDRQGGPPPDVPYGRGPRESSSADRIQGAAAASVILGELLLRSYSREYEDQADEEGQRMAAAAGFEPMGTAQLFDLMRRRIPQSKDYGYWRTHPFFAERVAAAEARGRQLRTQEPRPVARFRAGTQAVLLEFNTAQAVRGESAESLAQFLEQAALAAWPEGETADRLRRSSLERLRATVLEGPAHSRDYGRLLRAYEEQRRQVASATPESPFLEYLDQEVGTLREELASVYPEAVEVLAAGIYQTPFLERFLSNFPDAPEVPRVALALADAYARLGRPTEAVERYLQAWRADEEGETGIRAVSGLRHLASSVDRLSALEQLTEVDDPELHSLTRQRLGQLAGTYRELENGADYLRRFPHGSRAEEVETRLEHLAESLFGEIVLYQGVGDSMKALERIQRILTHAPLSAAAERLRDRAVVEG